MFSAITLSTQQIVDCTSVFPYENYGCNGGDLPDSYKYVMATGLNSSKEYPYVTKAGPCRVKPGQGRFKIRNYKAINPTCDSLGKALTIRPLAVGIDSTGWLFYKGGILPGPCIELNHAALLVASYPEYWIVKNQWGTNWGEKGFIRIAPGNTFCVC